MHACRTCSVDRFSCTDVHACLTLLTTQNIVISKQTPIPMTMVKIKVVE